MEFIEYLINVIGIDRKDFHCSQWWLRNEFVNVVDLKDQTNLAKYASLIKLHESMFSISIMDINLSILYEEHVS